MTDNQQGIRKTITSMNHLQQLEADHDNDNSLSCNEEFLPLSKYN